MSPQQRLEAKAGPAEGNLLQRARVAANAATRPMVTPIKPLYHRAQDRLYLGFVDVIAIG